MTLSASTLLLPAPDTTWRVWHPRSGKAATTVDSPAEAVPRGGALVVGLPATACRSIGMVLPNADHALLEQIIITQLERRGLKPQAEPPRNFRWHLLTQTAATATVSVDILADPFPDHLALTDAADYTAALRLVSLPAGQLVITEEQGSLVLAAGFQGRLYHSHLFAPATASLEEMAMEIQLARLALELDLGAGSLGGVTLAGASWEETQEQALAELCGMPVRRVQQLPPQAEVDASHWTRLLPAGVYASQAARARRARLTRGAVLAGALALALAFLAFAYLSFLERAADRLQAEVAANAETADRVRRTAGHWKALAPAIEPKRYPLVLLAEITKLMPPSGIVIRDCDIRSNEIDLRGEARDAQLAFQFVEDLQKHPVLGLYTWSKPQPTVREKTAQFRAQGKMQ
jgi:hypothetical protein